MYKFMIEIRHFVILQADLNTEKVKLALEPEAASVFCRYLPTERKDNKSDISTFSVGTQYLVLDAGGLFQS